MRSYLRATRGISASVRLIASTVLEVSRWERHAHRSPVRTSRKLHELSARLVDASARMARAARDLARTNACIARAPEESDADLPERLLETTEYWLEVAAWLNEVASDVFTHHRNILRGLQTGALVPERPADRRPRIVLVTRPVPVRAFLRLRQPCLSDRIASILLRRRRTPRPAALTVPPDTDQGRAPPLSAVCPF